MPKFLCHNDFCVASTNICCIYLTKNEWCVPSVTHLKKHWAHRIEWSNIDTYKWFWAIWILSYIAIFVWFCVICRSPHSHSIPTTNWKFVVVFFLHKLLCRLCNILEWTSLTDELFIGDLKAWCKFAGWKKKYLCTTYTDRIS